ncbi:MAG: hypothetical protein QW579_03955 [Desulfurococcaceae archaeon]
MTRKKALSILLLLLAIIHLNTLQTSSSNWVLEEALFRSSTGGSVYPGSSNAKLMIVVRYVGSIEALNPVACLKDIPPGFKLVGFSCIPARDNDGNIISIAKQGDVAYFTYTFNIDRNTVPGFYRAALNLTYYINNTMYWEVFSLTLTISDYPPLGLAVKDAYFTPYSYPGACPVRVILGIVNTGSASILNMRLTLELPKNLADPPILNSTYATRLDPGLSTYVDLGTTCIDPSASPNTTYLGILYVEAQLITDDGVTYSYGGYYTAKFVLEEAPSMKVRVLDYRLSLGVPISGFKNTGLKLLVESEEPGVLELLYSYLVLENAAYINGSTTVVYEHEITLDYLESTWISYTGINILDNATYVKAHLVLYGSVQREGTRYPVSVSLLLVIPIVHRELDIGVERITWSQSYAYPGSDGNTLVLVLYNNETEVSLEDAIVDVIIPGEVVFPGRLTAYNVYVNPGSLVEVVFTGIAVPSTTKPGVYEAIVNITCTLRARDNSFKYVSLLRYTIISINETPGVKLRVISYELTSNANIPGLRNTGLRILLESKEPGVLTLTHSIVSFDNAQSINGSTSATYIHNIVLNYLESTWIIYDGINIADDVTYVKIRAEVHGTLTRDSIKYSICMSLLLVVPVKERELGIEVLNTTWIKGYAYSGSSRNTLVVAVVNKETELRIENAIVKLVTEGLMYPDTLVIYNVALNPGTIVELTFEDITIPIDTKPGVYQFELRISGILRARDNSFKYVEISRWITATITDISRLNQILPVLNIVDAFWGELTPVYVYPGNARAPLTIVLQNTGITDALNIHLFVEDLEPNDVKVLNNVSECSTRLVPGSTCAAVFYLDLSNSSSGLKTISLLAKYNVNLGTDIVMTQRLIARVYLPSYPAGEGVVVSSYMWLNNNQVFPRTRGAILQLTIANLEPYTVYSVWVNLETPKCMSIHEGTPGTLYVSGPLASLQTTTVTFTLDMNNCSVGLHPALVKLDYYVQTAGGGIRRRSQHVISLLVQSDEKAVEYITSGWVTAPLEPPVHGAQLYVVFRNSELSSVNSPVLKLYLPPGVVDSKTNSSVATALPIGVSPQQVYTMLYGLPGDVAKVIQQLMQQPVVQVINKGEFMVYIISLNIDKVNLTQITIPYTLSFVDHWGFVYEVSSSFTITLLTSPPLLEVRTLTPVVVFGNGTAHLDILLVNNYGAPVSNVYVALIPETGNAIPQGAVKYIEKLDSYSSVKLRYELIYNPVEVLAAGGLAVSPTSAVFRVAVLYVDIAGTPRSFNTTLSAMIAPFIELQLVPGATARYTRGSLLVSGVLVNTGISVARSVAVYVKYGETEAMSIIGDVDPASQTPFRVEVRTPYTDDTCKLVVKYRDIYGSIYEFEEEIRVVYVPEEVTQTPTVQQPPVDLFKLIIIILVAVFLSGVAYIIYKHTKSVAKGSS